MDKDQTFPVYAFNPGQGLFAFMGKKEMYKIENRGGNMNEGLTIDHYITRTMVLKHWQWKGKVITKDQFISVYRKLFDTALIKMT